MAAIRIRDRTPAEIDSDIRRIVNDERLLGKKLSRQVAEALFEGTISRSDFDELLNWMQRGLDAKGQPIVKRAAYFATSVRPMFARAGQPFSNSPAERKHA